MSEHFCQEHGIAYFKKGRMKGYSHPIGNTKEWCNMPEGQEPMAEEESQTPPSETPQPSEKMSKIDWADKDSLTRASIEKQTAFNGMVQLLIANVVEKNGIVYRLTIGTGLTMMGYEPEDITQAIDATKKDKEVN